MRDTRAMNTNFEENNLTAIALNQARLRWNEPKIVSKYRNGKHGTEWQTYTVGESLDQSFALTAMWEHLGLTPGDRIGIMAKNRPRWIFTLNSILLGNFCAVTIYPTLTADEAAFVLRDSGTRYVVVDSMERALLLQSVLDSLPDLEGIVVMDACESPVKAPLYSFDEFVAEGRKHHDEGRRSEVVRSITPDDAAAIIYTSGTTGVPKGVVLTHRNFLSQRPLQTSFDLSPDDIFLNHLPFSHCFGLTADLFGASAVGATLVIADGVEPANIRHALQTIRPTVLMSVPRLYEKVYIQVHQVVSAKPRFVQNLIAGALDTGKRVFDLRSERQPIPAGLALKHRLAQRILGKVLRQAGLERVRLAYAGGAPSSKDLCGFYQALGIELLQGYGLTETSPVTNVNFPGRNKLGTVGPPIEGVEVALAEDGEVLVRGECVMRGYFNNPEATAAVVDEAGWFHTGDIGQIDDDGYLSIVDRKKEIIVTSGGKNVAPLAIESRFNTDPYIERVVLIGDRRNYLTALVCPDFDTLRAWAASAGLDCETREAIAAHPEIRALIEARVAEVNQGLARFEQIKKFAILPVNFSTDSGEITPTEKLKRKFIAEKYAAEIDALYADSGR